MNLRSSSKLQLNQLLKISSLSLSQIQNLATNQQNAIWRSLLKVQASRKNEDHSKAITELKLAKSQIVDFMRNTFSKNNQIAYEKVMVCILAHLIHRLFGAKKFKDANEAFKQLKKLLNKTQLIKQALYIMFGVVSFVALKNYNMQSNSQFKYPPATQIMFYYIVGKVKLVGRKNEQAFNCFKKILTLVKSFNPGAHILVRIYDSLSQLQPIRYRLQYQKFIKTLPSSILPTIQQKIIGQQIMRQLLDKQQQIVRQTAKQQPKPMNIISKRMLCIYLNYLIRKDQNESQQGFMYLLKNLQQQTNQKVLKQLLEQSKLSKQASRYYIKKFTNIYDISIKYHFRKINNFVKSQVKQLEKYSRVNQSKVIKSNSNLKKPRNIKLYKIPKDLNRTIQILNKCKHGSIISKVNFGNNSVASKFARIQQKKFVWADNQKEIQYGSSCIKWKNVLGIVYGKVSQNLNKPQHYQLRSWRCFSLITKDRSYDFYCQNETQIYFWLQGISYYLQVFHKNVEFYPFYSKGRVLWKMLLLKAAFKYVNSSKKYKCKNAGIIIQFQKKQSRFIK